MKCQNCHVHVPVLISTFLFCRAHFIHEPDLAHEANLVEQHAALLERQWPIEVLYLFILSMPKKNTWGLCQSDIRELIVTLILF